MTGVGPKVQYRVTHNSSFAWQSERKSYKVDKTELDRKCSLCLEEMVQPFAAAFFKRDVVHEFRTSRAIKTGS